MLWYIYVIPASKLWVCNCFYWCRIQLSEWIVHQRRKEVKFDSLPLNISYARLNWPPHALTSGRRVPYPVRRRTLACWWVLRIAAFSVTDELPGVPVSSPLPSRGPVCQRLNPLPHRLPQPYHYFALKCPRQTLICMEIDILWPKIKSVFCRKVRRGREINKFKSKLTV